MHSFFLYFFFLYLADEEAVCGAAACILIYLFTSF